MSTITIPKVLANFETSLAATMSAAATSLTLNASVDGDGTTLSGLYSLTFDEGSSSEEHMLVMMTGASGAVSRRGLSRVDAWTEVTANKLVHNRGASVKVTNVSAINIQRLLNGDETFDSVNWLGVNSITGLATPTSSETSKAANVDFVVNTALAGAVDASTTVKGIVEEATDAELQAGTAAGGTSARLFAGGASHTQTATANKVPVGKSSGKLDDGWLGLTTAGDTVYSDGTDLQRLAKGTTGYFLEAGASAPTWGGANLAEANTFFGATDITGAEAETLTAGTASDADTLHIHKMVRGLVDYSITTGADTTKTVTIPANTLKTGGMIRATFMFNYVSNNLGVTFGGTSLGTFNTDTVYEITIIQTSTGNQTASMYKQGDTSVPTQTVLTKDTTTSLDLAFAVSTTGAIYSLTVEVIHSI